MPTALQPLAASLSFKEILEVAKDVLTIGAIVIGGAWAYVKYWRGRVHKPRLTLKSSAAFVTSEPYNYLFTTLTIENIGLSRVDISRDKCWLLVFPQRPPTRTPAALAKMTNDGPSAHSTFKVFEDREGQESPSFWIEPGATQTRTHAFRLLPDRSCSAYVSEYQILGSGILFRTDSLARTVRQANRPRE